MQNIFAAFVDVSPEETFTKSPFKGDEDISGAGSSQFAKEVRLSLSLLFCTIFSTAL